MSLNAFRIVDGYCFHTNAGKQFVAQCGARASKTLAVIRILLCGIPGCSSENFQVFAIGLRFQGGASYIINRLFPMWNDKHEYDLLVLTWEVLPFEFPLNPP